jgi:hypothetical protein
MVKVLRVKPFGTQFGGTGTIRTAPGATANVRGGNTTMEFIALAKRRVAAYPKMDESIKSKGKL